MSTSYYINMPYTSMYIDVYTHVRKQSSPLSLVCECRSLCIVWTERALRGRQPLCFSQRLQPPEGLNIRGGNSELPRVWQLTDCIMYSSHVIGQSQKLSVLRGCDASVRDTLPWRCQVSCVFEHT